MITDTAEAPPATGPARLTNVELGELIGLSHSSASRVRSGQRAPGYRVMLAIERHFQWALQDQVRVLDQDRQTYGEELERHATAYLERRAGATAAA